jgi:hypothetical protein
LKIEAEELKHSIKGKFIFYGKWSVAHCSNIPKAND